MSAAPRLLDQIPAVTAESTAGPDGRRRQAAVWRGETPDYLPLLVEGLGQPWDGADFDLPSQARDPDRMLHEALRSAERTVPVVSDSVLCMRPQFGVGLFSTPFGVKYELSQRYGAPWVVEHVSKERLSAMEPGDLDLDGSLIGQSAGFLRRFTERLEGRLATYLPDSQGPFDIAHLARGHDLLTDLFDDPPFVHHLMELATHVYIEGNRLLKAASGEAPDVAHHSGAFYMERCGVRLCDDSGTILSPGQYAEFALPYHARCFEAFGGGWAHWCGWAPHLVNDYLGMPFCRGINFGQPEMYDAPGVMARVQSAGKVYVGMWPREPGEGLAAYCERMLGMLGGRKSGLILQLPPRPGETPADLMSAWHAAHERVGLT